MLKLKAFEKFSCICIQRYQRLNKFYTSNILSQKERKTFCKFFFFTFRQPNVKFHLLIYGNKTNISAQKEQMLKESMINFWDKSTPGI